MTEAFLNTPLGAQDDSMNAYLRQKDPDSMMLNLGMALSGDREAIAGGDNLSLSSGGHPPPPLPPQALLGEGETQAAAAGTNGSPSSPPPSELPPSLLSSMVAAGGGGEAAAAAAVGWSGGLGSGAAAAAAQDFTYLVRTLGAHGRFEEARARVIPEMRRRGIVPTDRTFAALVAGAAVDRNPDAAEEVFERKYGAARGLQRTETPTLSKLPNGSVAFLTY